MLICRFGELVAPTELACSFCPKVTPAGEMVYIQQTECIHEKLGHDEDWETMCPSCYYDIKHAMMKFKVPIEWDCVPEGLRVAKNGSQNPLSLRVKEF